MCHATLDAGDYSVAEALLPKPPRWPKWLAMGFGVGLVVRLLLKDMQMGWSRALQLYLFSLSALLLAITFGLGRWLTVRPSPERLMARLGLVTHVLTVELDEEGLVYGSVCKRAWSEFHRFSENERGFVLQGQPPLLHVIPKRAFALDDLVRARALMHTKITLAATADARGTAAR